MNTTLPINKNIHSYQFTSYHDGDGFKLVNSATYIPSTYPPKSYVKIIQDRINESEKIDNKISSFFKNFIILNQRYWCEIQALLDCNQCLDETNNKSNPAIGINDIWECMINSFEEEQKANRTFILMIDRLIKNDLDLQLSTEKKDLTIKLNRYLKDYTNAENKLNHYYRIQHDKQLVHKNHYDYHTLNDKYQRSKHIWNTQMPLIFNRFEQSEVDRLNSIKESLMQFQSVRISYYNERCEINEQTSDNISIFDGKIETTKFMHSVINQMQNIDDQEENNLKPGENLSINPIESADADDHECNSIMSQNDFGHLTSESSIDLQEPIKSDAKVTSNNYNNGAKDFAPITPTVKTSTGHKSDAFAHSQLKLSPKQKLKSPSKLRSKVASFIFGKKHTKSTHKKSFSLSKNIYSPNKTKNINTTIVSNKRSRSADIPVNSSIHVRRSFSNATAPASYSVDFGTPSRSSALVASTDTPFRLQQADKSVNIEHTDKINSFYNTQRYITESSLFAAHINRDDESFTPIQIRRHIQSSKCSIERRKQRLEARRNQNGNLNLNELLQQDLSTSDRQEIISNHEEPSASTSNPNINILDQQQLQRPSLMRTTSYVSSSYNGPVSIVDATEFVDNENAHDHQEITNPGLNISVSEVYKTSFKNNELIASEVNGEVGFTFNHTMSSLLFFPREKIPMKFKVNDNYSNTKVIMKKEILEKNSTGNDVKNIFLINVPEISDGLITGLKYSSNDIISPILVRPVWNFEHGETTISLMLKLNPDYFGSNDVSLLLSELKASIGIFGTQVTSVYKMPKGQFNRNTNRITWNLDSFNSADNVDKSKESGAIRLFTNHEEKLFCRIITTGLAKEDNEGISLTYKMDSININDNNIATNGVKFSYFDIPETALDNDEIGDEDAEYDCNDTTMNEGEWKLIPGYLNISSNDI